MADQSQQPEHDAHDLPESMIRDLKQMHGRHVFVPTDVDRAVLDAAERQLAPLRRRRQFIRGIRGVRGLPWAVAAVVAMAVGGVWLAESFRGLPQPLQPGQSQIAAMPGDILNDGRVTVLDAFALARHLASDTPRHAEWDINGDGRVDEHDVHAIAQKAVALNRSRS